MAVIVVAEEEMVVVGKEVAMVEVVTEVVKVVEVMKAEEKAAV